MAEMVSQHMHLAKRLKVAKKDFLLELADVYLLLFLRTKQEAALVVDVVNILIIKHLQVLVEYMDKMVITTRKRIVVMDMELVIVQTIVNSEMGK